jgi:hypothetical protein
VTRQPHAHVALTLEKQKLSEEEEKIKNERRKYFGLKYDTQNCGVVEICSIHILNQL